MAVFIRNLEQPTIANARGTSVNPMVKREMLLSGYWTEESNDGDAAWANNILATPADFAVSANVDGRITAPSAPFTQAMADDGDFITLLASNDHNRGVYRIARYIDASTVEIAVACRVPGGWTTESGIAGRIVGVNDNLLTNGAWLIMDSPGAGTHLQVRLYMQDSSWGYAYIRPRGKDFSGVGDAIGGVAPTMTLTDSAGAFTPGMVGLTVTIAGATTPANDGTFTIVGYTDPTIISYTNGVGVAEAFAGTWDVNGLANETAGILAGGYYQNYFFYNGYFDGDTALIYGFENSVWFEVHCYGELDVADPSDHSPGYVYGFQDTGYNYDVYVYSNTLLCKMLDINEAQIEASTCCPKPYSDRNISDCFESKLSRRLINGGYAPLRKPQIALDDVATVGGCVRGKLQGIRWCNKTFESLRPLDGAGNWLHIGGGLVVPRNGPNDSMPLIP